MTTMYNTYYDVSRLTLWGDKRDGKYAPRLSLSFANGNPRFVVYTGQENVKPINFPADPIILTTVLDRLETIASGPNGIKTSVTSLTTKYVDNQRTNDKRLVSTLHMGKNKDGIVYILIKEEGKPDIPFAFKKNEWHEFKNENKEEYDEATMSAYFAKAFASLTRNALAVFIERYTRDTYQDGEYKPRVMGDGSNNQQNNSQGKRAYGSKGTEKAMASFDAIDDDIGF